MKRPFCIFGFLVAIAMNFATAVAIADSVFLLGDQGQINLPDGYEALDGNKTRAMMRTMGEPVSNQEVGFITPKDQKADWSVYFEFNPIGYVKDDEKDSLDADAI